MIDHAMKGCEEEGIVEETIMGLDKVESGEFHLCNEYLVEISKTSDGKRYWPKVYRLVANGPNGIDSISALRKVLKSLSSES